MYYNHSISSIHIIVNDYDAISLIYLKYFLIQTLRKASQSLDIVHRYKHIADI